MACIAILITGVIFAVIRKPLKTRAIFVFISLMLVMLFPQKLADVFYLLPVGILLLTKDYVTVLGTKKESKFKW